MVKVVKAFESGTFVEELTHTYGISKGTLYNRKSKYSGMEGSQVKRLKELEEENRRLKKIYSDLALNNDILREVVEKNSRARDKKGLDRENRGRAPYPHLSGVLINGNYYYKKKRDDAEVVDAICSAAVYGEGFQKIYICACANRTSPGTIKDIQSL
jgi:putative transposase